MQLPTALAPALLLVATLASCARPAPAPASTPSAAPASTPATGSASTAAATAAPVPAVASPAPTPAPGDRFDPAVTSVPAGWLVGWTEAAPPGAPRVGTRVAVAFVAAPAHEDTPLTPSAELDADGAAALRLAGPQAVWLRGTGASRALLARRLTPTGTLDPALPTVTLATGPDLGLPALIAYSDGPVVAWTDGLTAHAARLGPDGAVTARASWYAGNSRPSRIVPAPPGPRERSRATAARPWLRVTPDGLLDVVWTADWWFSDDEGGFATAHHSIVWGESPTADPDEAPSLGTVWSSLAALDGPLALVADHDPNGGPWTLALHHLGPAPLPLVSGPAGPFTVTLTATPVPAVAFHDPATSTYRLLRLSPDGALLPERALPTLAPFGEAALALAPPLTPDAPFALATTTVAAGRLTVRLATIAPTETGLAPGPLLARPPAAPVSLPLRFSAATADAVRVGEHTLLTWQDSWDWHVRAVWLTDGAPVAPPRDLSSGAPRAEGGAALALPDGAALVAFHTCDSVSLCSTTRLRVLRLRPDAAPVPVDLGALPDDRHPRLCLGPSGPVLAVQRGAYGTVVATWDAAAGRHTSTFPTPDRNNGAFAQGLACGPAGLFAPVTSFGAASGTTRLDLVAFTPAGAAARDTLTTPGSLWSPRALLADPAGVTLITNVATETGGDVTLRTYPADPAAAPTSTLLWRGRTALHPHLAAAGDGPDRRLAAAWYERASDGVYAVLASPTAGRLVGPVRLDDPARRESHGAPVIVREGDTWQVYWEEADRLMRASPF